MTDDETRAKAQQSAAFVRGYEYAVRESIEATVPLVRIINRLMWNAWTEGDADDHVELTALAELERATFAEVHRLRDCGAVAALQFFDFERAMAGSDDGT